MRIEEEPIIADFIYKKYKFNNNIKSVEDTIIIPMFSEFGCEVLGCIYCLPEIVQKYANKHIIILGWHGRSFLYKDLVDEMWELDPKLQWLRKYCKAFHHESKNLKKFEIFCSQFGKVISVHEVSAISFRNKQENCVCGGEIKELPEQICVSCGRNYGTIGIYFQKDYSKGKWITTSEEAKNRISLPENSVGICARNRVTYGRNLSIDFYKKLIYNLEDLGYNPVWFGEPDSTYECPFKRIPDYRGISDLEDVIALVSKMKFTVQCYTASTRIAALANIPFLLVESPDQLWGNGQEGRRLELLSRLDNKKLIACDFLEAYNNEDSLLDLVLEGIKEMEIEDYSSIIGLVSNYRVTCSLRSKFERIFAKSC